MTHAILSVWAGYLICNTILSKPPTTIVVQVGLTGTAIKTVY